MSEERQPDPKALYVEGTRILGPFDYDRFSAAIPRLKHRTIFKAYFWAGLRYVEGQRLHDNPEWYIPEREVIRLPKEAQKKHKQKLKVRYIPVKDQLAEVIEYFLDGQRPPTLQAWDKNLKSWAVKADMNPYGFNARMTRKSVESWMLTAGIPEYEVYQRQGHDPLTSMRHYQGLAFTKEEKGEIKRRLVGWTE